MKGLLVVEMVMANNHNFSEEYLVVVPDFLRQMLDVLILKIVFIFWEVLKDSRIFLD